MSEKQLQLVDGEIIETEDHKYELTDKALEQRQKAALVKKENAEMLRMVCNVGEISQKADINDPQSLLDCFHEYLNEAVKSGSRIGNMNAYAAMGITHQTADQWMYGRARRDDPRYKNLILYVKRICSAYREALSLEGKINPILTIFWQKNFDGLTNEEHTVVDFNDPLGDTKSIKEIQEKYADLPED